MFKEVVKEVVMDKEVRKEVIKGVAYGIVAASTKELTAWSIRKAKGLVKKMKDNTVHESIDDVEIIDPRA